MIRAIAGATQVQADLAMRGRAVLLTMAPADLLIPVRVVRVIRALVVVNILAPAVLLTTVQVVRDTLVPGVPLTMVLAGLLTTVQVAHVMRVQAVRVIQVLAEEINVLQFVGRNNIRRISEGGGDPKSRLAGLDCMGIDERLSWFLYRWKAENQILSASANFALL